MNTAVHWRYVGEDDDLAWRQVRCLYTYQAPRHAEILYVGLAWRATVRARWCRMGKSHFWDDLEAQRKMRSHRVLIGEMMLFPEERLTRQLLGDVESLLIHRLQPWGNIACQLSRIESPGLVVTCRGDWPHSQRRFKDVR